MAWEEGKKAIEEMVRGAAGGVFKGVRLGPGLLGNLAMVAIAIFSCIAVIAWSFSKSPLIALGLVGLIIVFAFYFTERMVRFAQKNPAAALLGGTEFYHHLKEQIAAKDPAVINDDRITGAGPMTIEHQAQRNA